MDRDIARLPVQVVCRDDVGTPFRDQLHRRLENEGLACISATPSPDVPFCILAIHGNTTEITDQVRDLSRGGDRRLFVIAVSRESLEGLLPWILLHAGASDVMAWDDSSHPAAAIAARLERWQQIEELLQSHAVQSMLVGQSRAWRSALRQIVEVARFTDSSILLTGESGTGKELVARMVHQLDPRPTKRELVVLDCTTVVPELSGSEFFGHERGSFTHAFAAREGAFSLADGGTLFLDEVGELPPSLQAELLRVVQERAYKRVGSNAWRETRFRLICATNRDLIAEEAQGRFRRDLYFRIASWVFSLPPLRERRDDILPLTRHFLGEVFGPGAIPELDPKVRDYLLVRDYPGNIRELRQLVHRLAKKHVGQGPITLGDLPETPDSPACRAFRHDWRQGDLERVVRHALSQGVGLRELTGQTAEIAIRVALSDEQDNLHRAAVRLRVTDRALQMRRAANHRRERNELESQGSTDDALTAATATLPAPRDPPTEA